MYPACFGSPGAGAGFPIKIMMIFQQFFFKTVFEGLQSKIKGIKTFPVI